MPSEQEQMIDKPLLYLISLANRVNEASSKAKSLRVNCMETSRRVTHLLQILQTLLCLINSDPALLYLNPIRSVLEMALSLACKCQRKPTFYPLFTATIRTSFHNLHHLLDACIAQTNRLLIINNPDFDTIDCDEIFQSLPRLILDDGSPVVEDYRIATPVKSSMIKELEKLLFCLAKKSGSLLHSLHLHNRLMLLVEITAAAESNIDIRCKAFKTHSPGSNATVELLLRVIKESDDCTFKVLAIKSIGSLARIFRESDNHQVISALVPQLENGDRDVVREALVALLKFSCECNHLCKEHSNRMIEFNAAQVLVKLLSDGERELVLQFHGFVLICSIALNGDYSAGMERARIGTAIRRLLTKKRGLRMVVSKHPVLKELATTAIDCCYE